MNTHFKSIFGLCLIFMQNGFSTDPTHRITRQPSEYTIELLVLYDTGVKNQYGSKISEYIKTLVALANDAYRHESLGTSLSIVLKKIIHVPNGIIVHRNPGSSLKNLKQKLASLRNSTTARSTICGRLPQFGHFWTFSE